MLKTFHFIFLVACFAHSIVPNNAYSYLLVSIDKDLDLPEDKQDDFIRELKALITDTSAALYEATYNRVYLKSVIIVVPQSWKIDDVENFGAYFTKPDVVVSNVGYGGKAPYTIQGGMCGGPGLKMSLPFQYVMDKDIQDNYGDPAILMANELLKLRYGVYAEFGYPEDPWAPYSFFDTSRNTTRITSCSNPDEIQGYWIDEERQDCIPSESDPYCRLLITSVDADYSTLFVASSPKVTKVCDKEKHDYMAPTIHNKICGKSVFDVMMQHPDFKYGHYAEYAPGDDDVSTNSSFVLLQMKYMPTMLLIDIDGGDNQEEVSYVLKEIKKTIALILDNESVPSLGIAYFSGVDQDFEVVYYLNQTLIPLQDIDPENITDFLPTDPAVSFSSQAGHALNETLERLDNEADEHYINVILIQTQRSTDDVPHIYPLEHFYSISGVLYGGDSNNDWLENLTIDTLGLYYVDVDYNPSFATSLILSVTTDLNMVMLLQENVDIENGSYEVLNVYIDESIGINTTFKVVWDASVKAENLAIKLTDPSGNQKEPTSQNAQAEVFLIDDAANGMWSLTLSSNATNNMTVKVTVTSQPREEEDQVQLKVWTSSSEYMHDLMNSPLAFFASLRIGPNPVIGANVYVKLSTSSTKESGKMMMHLYDDGKGLPDMTLGDGIYSGYLSSLEDFEQVIDEYTLLVDVMIKSSTNEPKYLFTGSSEESSPSFMRSMAVYPFLEDPMPSPIERPLDRLILSAYSLNISGTLDYDPPPSPIVDFNIVEVVSVEGEDTLTATMQWRAPGENFTYGTVEQYDIRYTTNYSDLNDFELWKPVSKSMITEGSLTPKPSGSEQTITVMLNKTEENYYFAIRGIDAAGNEGGLSAKANVFGDFVGEYKKTFVTTTTTTTTTTPPTNPDDFVGSAGFIILIIFSVLVIAAGVGAVIFYYLNKRGSHTTDRLKSKFRRGSRRSVDS